MFDQPTCFRFEWHPIYPRSSVQLITIRERIMTKSVSRFTNGDAAMKRAPVAILLVVLGAAISLFFFRATRRSTPSAPSAAAQPLGNQSTSPRRAKPVLSPYMRNAGLTFVEEVDRLAEANDVHIAKLQSDRVSALKDRLEINANNDDDKKFLEGLSTLHSWAVTHASAVTTHFMKAPAAFALTMNKWYFRCYISARAAIKNGEYDPTDFEESCGYKEPPPSCE